METLADFKKMTGAGVGRVVTSHGYDFYLQWMKEAEMIRYIPPKTEEEKVENATKKPMAEGAQPAKTSQNVSSGKNGVNELKFI